MQEIQQRWKSPVVILSVLGLLVSTIGNLGVYETIGLDQSIIMKIIESIIDVMCLLGILNNPTDKKNF